MTGNVAGAANSNGFSLENLPAAARQAIYHHVTGKTETLSQHFKKNVIITANDFDHLHGMLCDQLGTLHKEYGPTTTVEVKLADSRNMTHSSWEHYKKVSTITTEVTSEIILKMEFVLNIQDTPGPQRCVVSVGCDSALPLLVNKDDAENVPLSFWHFISEDWQTVTVTIDFVDFMVARGFASIVDAWFKTLKPTPAASNNKKKLENYRLLSNLSGQVGRLGMAAFLATFALIKGDQINFQNSFYAVAAGMTLWSLYLMVRSPILKWGFNRITSGIMPSIVMLTKIDEEKYQQLIEKRKSQRATTWAMWTFAGSNIALNIISSYIWSVILKM